MMTGPIPRACDGRHSGAFFFGIPVIAASAAAFASLVETGSTEYRADHRGGLEATLPFAATAGLAPVPAFLTTDWVLDRCRGDGGPTRAYRRFVAAGRGATPWQDRRRKIYLGGDAFVKGITEALDAGAANREIPRAHRRRPAKELAN